MKEEKWHDEIQELEGKKLINVKENKNKNNEIPPHTLPYMSSFTIVGIILQKNIFNERTQNI